MATKQRRKIWLDRELPTSKAFLALRGKAIHVLIIFHTKLRMSKHNHRKRAITWEITNNGEIVFTYEEAKKYGFAPKTFSRIISDLMDKGFLDIASPGTGIGKTPTLYTISDRWQAYGTPEFVRKERVKRCSYRFPRGDNNPSPLKKKGNANCQQ